MSNDTVFCIRADEWQIRVNDRVRPHTFNSKGAALAGIEVERRRDEIAATVHTSRTVRLFADGTIKEQA